MAGIRKVLDTLDENRLAGNNESPSRWNDLLQLMDKPKRRWGVKRMIPQLRTRGSLSSTRSQFLSGTINVDVNGFPIVPESSSSSQLMDTFMDLGAAQVSSCEITLDNTDLETSSTRTTTNPDISFDTCIDGTGLREELKPMQDTSEFLRIKNKLEFKRSERSAEQEDEDRIIALDSGFNLDGYNKNERGIKMKENKVGSGLKQVRFVVKPEEVKYESEIEELPNNDLTISSRSSTKDEISGSMIFPLPELCGNEESNQTSKNWTKVLDLDYLEKKEPEIATRTLSMPSRFGKRGLNAVDEDSSADSEAVSGGHPRFQSELLSSVSRNQPVSSATTEGDEMKMRVRWGTRGRLFKRWRKVSVNMIDCAGGGLIMYLTVELGKGKNVEEAFVMRSRSRNGKKLAVLKSARGDKSLVEVQTSHRMLLFTFADRQAVEGFVARINKSN